MSWKIRKAQVSEMQQVNNAHIRSIRNVVVKDYNQEQIDAWSDMTYTNDHWTKSLIDDHYRVVEIDGEIEGFCHSRVLENGNGEVLGLYLTEKALGQGIGRCFIDDAYEFFRGCGISEVIVLATKTALGFYQKMGFELTKEKVNHTIRGVAMECYPLRIEL